LSKFYYINPIGKESPDLFQTFTPIFIKEGHEIVDRVEDADVVFWDLFSGLGEYDENIMKIVVAKELPTIVWDESDFGAMSKESWEIEKWVAVSEYQKIVYFMRKMSKEIKYPSWVYPCEKTIQNIFPITTKEELCSRPYDAFFAGNVSPTRKNFIDGLIDGGLKVDVHWTNENGKLPYDEWLKRARQSKLFITSDGGGFSDERPYQLITVAAMLRQKNNHLQAHPFTDCVNCLEASECPTQEEIEGIKTVLNDHDYLYEIYLEGINHMKEHYSPEARAKYLLSILTKEGIV